MDANAVPARLDEIVGEFLDLEEAERLQLLMEYSEELPEVPATLEHDPRFERVAECQSPVFIALDVSPSGIVTMYAKAPAEAPTTRGFASILVRTVSGLSRDEALALPDDLPRSLGLGRVVSPLRIAGMAGMLARAKRQLRGQRPS